MYFGIGKTAKANPMTGSEPNRRALTNDSDSINGTGLTNGFGIKNGFGMTNEIGFVNGSRPTRGFYPFMEGFTNGKQVGEANGLKVKVELINGFTIESIKVIEDPPSGWSRSARKRQAVRKALLKKSMMPIPGGE